MKIRINQDIVEFTPENPAEKTELEALWIKMANCIGKTKRLERRTWRNSCRSCAV